MRPLQVAHHVRSLQACDDVGKNVDSASSPLCHPKQASAKAHVCLTRIS